MRPRIWLAAWGGLWLALSPLTGLALETQTARLFGPVDVSLEPVLQGNTAGFIRDGALFLASAASPEPTLLRAPPANGMILSPQLARYGRKLWAAWIERNLDGNRLSAVSFPEEAGSEVTTALTAENTRSTLVRLTAAQEGAVALIEGSTTDRPELTLRLSREGRTLSERRRIPLDELDQLRQMAAVADGDSVLVAVHGQKAQEPVILLVDCPIESDSPIRTEKVTDTSITPLLEIVPTRPAPTILFKGPEGAEPSLQIATKREGSWSVAPLAGSVGLDVARLDHATWPDGRVLVVFSGEQRGAEKQRVFASATMGSGKPWTTTQIDSARFGSTRAWLPRLATKGDEVLVVWEDSRDIRARIRMQHSGDRGETWLPRDLSLSDPAFHGFRPRISAGRDGVTVAWQQYRTDARLEADLALRRFSWAEVSELVRTAAAVEPVPDPALLAEAVRRYWQAMVDNDLQTAYDAHDPFYRAQVPFVQYAARRGPIAYHSFRIEQSDVRGNEAIVRLTVNYSVPRFTLLGETHSVPARDFPIVETWLRVDGIWARKFVDAMSGGSAISY